MSLSLTGIHVPRLESSTVRRGPRNVGTAACVFVALMAGSCTINCPLVIESPSLRDSVPSKQDARGVA
ncbi:hypothetical protein PI124_g8368 [Phytophthora idaei]|nr:hypothetical protein PI125_g8676 [Phytophthora idaei]KAG3159309.1 hypothetical protein PI126_g7453 [Phytophthora idaei]KAG3246899.1 hypothetical protein PI124_g8368 [Phytophthora idaei]